MTRSIFDWPSFFCQQTHKWVVDNFLEIFNSYTRLINKHLLSKNFWVIASLLISLLTINIYDGDVNFIASYMPNTCDHLHDKKKIYRTIFHWVIFILCIQMKNCYDFLKSIVNKVIFRLYCLSFLKPQSPRSSSETNIFFFVLGLRRRILLAFLLLLFIYSILHLISLSLLAFLVRFLIVFLQER